MSEKMLQEVRKTNKKKFSSFLPSSFLSSSYPTSVVASGSIMRLTNFPRWVRALSLSEQERRRSFLEQNDLEEFFGSGAAGVEGVEREIDQEQKPPSTDQWSLSLFCLPTFHSIPIHRNSPVPRIVGVTQAMRGLGGADDGENGQGERRRGRSSSSECALAAIDLHLFTLVLVCLLPFSGDESSTRAKRDHDEMCGKKGTLDGGIEGDDHGRVRSLFLSSRERSRKLWQKL